MAGGEEGSDLVNPKTAHKGLEIVFREYDEKWSCNSINKANESLPKLKKAIDAWDRKIRKSSAVEALTLSTDLPKAVGQNKARGQGDPGARFNPFRVVEYVGKQWRDPDTVAAMPEGGSRRHMRLTNLIRKSPENEAVLDRANAVAGEIWPLLSRFWMILDELDYCTIEDVAALKEIHERHPDDEKT